MSEVFVNFSIDFGSIGFRGECVGVIYGLGVEMGSGLGFIKKFEIY